ncbi:MAG TPA: ribonuclease J [Candidatus Portnoybacteria bacterium]|nr:ribonuclease J [Candidatus Portnoybacteria bacterium]
MEKTQKKIKIIPLGGVEEVGRNMTAFEYNDKIIIVDMGLQFPEETMPGIDYIIPNISYLQNKKEKIQGVIITHAHYDHIGAIPYLIPKLGNPPIYATPLTAGIILKRQEEFPDKPKLNIQKINRHSQLKLGDFNIEFFHVNHNIPDGVGVVIKTPVGTIVHSGDFKFDHSPIGDSPADISRIAQIGGENVLCFLSDSTNADQPGYCLSEKKIQDELELIFKVAQGRIIVATFASLVQRIQEIINLAHRYNRKLVIDGLSMKTNVEISQHLGFLNIPRGMLIRASQIDHYPDDQIVILCTGAQGEDRAVLMRITNREHRFVKIKENDSVVFSSSVVPGNERSVQELKDLLVRQGARVYHSTLMDIHASGHGYQEDLKMMINLIKPKFFIPIHGHFYMLKNHAELAQSVGVKPENIIIPSDGLIIYLTPEKIYTKKEKVPSGYIMVDGLGVGDVGQIVLRDRQTMAQDGMFVVIIIIDSQTGKVKTSPDIISRGFIYLKESRELLKDVRRKTIKIVEDATAHPSTQNGHISINDTYIKNNIRDELGKFLYERTKRRPMVLPVLIEI